MKVLVDRASDFLRYVDNTGRVFGQRGDWAFDVQDKFVNMRYRLLPYLYSTAWHVTNQDRGVRFSWQAASLLTLPCSRT